METFYFCLYLTESEHWIVSTEIEKFCETCDALTVVYYRTLKDGHWPMYREVKVEGSKSSIEHFKRWMVNHPKPSQALVHHVRDNPYKRKTQ